MTAPTVYTSHRDQNVPDYAGGFITLDLGNLPAGKYSIHIVVSATVASGLTPPTTRDLFCALDTVPASPLAVNEQTTFPSLDANGNAFAQMAMLGTLEAPAALAVRLRCELSPTTNTPDVQVGGRMVAIEADQVVQL